VVLANINQTIVKSPPISLSICVVLLNLF